MRSGRLPTRREASLRLDLCQPGRRDFRGGCYLADTTASERPSPRSQDTQQAALLTGESSVDARLGVSTSWLWAVGRLRDVGLRARVASRGIRRQ